MVSLACFAGLAKFKGNFIDSANLNLSCLGPKGEDGEEARAALAAV